MVQLLFTSDAGSGESGIRCGIIKRDAPADICLDAKGNPEPDAELRDTEIVALPKNIACSFL